mmetsp:Transcript_5542/g.15554  ORF Transcript_5542/g.15554 Transcript_5542/m.15554 type:complete len:337 (-) Transcript_5542:291-1301(-)
MTGPQCARPLPLPRVPKWLRQSEGSGGATAAPLRWVHPRALRHLAPLRRRSSPGLFRVAGSTRCQRHGPLEFREVEEPIHPILRMRVSVAVEVHEALHAAEHTILNACWRNANNVWLHVKRGKHQTTCIVKGYELGIPRGAFRQPELVVIVLVDAAEFDDALHYNSDLAGGAHDETAVHEGIAGEAPILFDLMLVENVQVHAEFRHHPPPPLLPERAHETLLCGGKSGILVHVGADNDGRAVAGLHNSIIAVKEVAIAAPAVHNVPIEQDDDAFWVCRRHILGCGEQGCGLGEEAVPLQANADVFPHAANYACHRQSRVRKPRLDSNQRNSCGGDV